MVVFQYDKSFEGLLTGIFDAYFRRTFPDLLIGERENLPLFYDEVFLVTTDEEKSGRVWKGIEKKLSGSALSCITLGWLSETEGVDMLLFRYIRKVLDHTHSIKLNFGDPDVLELTKIAKKVSAERHRVMQFARFQKTSDGIYFAPFRPDHNVLSLVLPYFKDRFADQKWIVYDLKSGFGFFYDLQEVTEITFDEKSGQLFAGVLDESVIDKEEKLFQQMWKTYFKSIAIKERINPKLHRQHMPVR
ncbi:MAG: TIGR03915 family putative DNA repair protein [Bacteroides sp.]|nr:TIGR03915 family putative DNA repair protein [Bacteroides sp.]